MCWLVKGLPPNSPVRPPLISLLRGGKRCQFGTPVTIADSRCPSGCLLPGPHSCWMPQLPGASRLRVMLGRTRPCLTDEGARRSREGTRLHCGLQDQRGSRAGPVQCSCPGTISLPSPSPCHTVSTTTPMCPDPLHSHCNPFRDVPQTQGVSVP